MTYLTFNNQEEAKQAVSAAREAGQRAYMLCLNPKRFEVRIWN